MADRDPDPTPDQDASAATGAERARVARVGDSPRQLRAFFRDALDEVYPYLLRRTGYDQATAEDLCQETFLRAVRALQDESVDEMSIGWLITVARSRFIDHCRSESRRDRHLRLVRDQAAVEPSADSTSDDIISADTVERMLAELPASQRLNVALHYLDGLPVAAIADATNTSVRAVESSLARARRTLRTRRTIGEQT